MNKAEIKRILKTAREAKGKTQTEMAEILSIAMNQPYTMRQYQRYEEGLLPKYKREVVKELDNLLGTNLFEKYYGKNGVIDVDSGLILKDSEEPSKSYLEKRRQKKGLSDPYMVPMVPVKAQAGYARSYSNTDFINELEGYPILPGVNPTGAIWRYFEVQGESMEPRLFEHDIALVSMVPYEYWREAKIGDIYVIVTNEVVLIKKLLHKTDTEWVLESVNKRHKQKKILIEEIKELWHYYKRITK